MEKNLLKTFGSPLYVYDEQTIYNRATDLIYFAEYLEQETGAKVKLHYSTKSNGNPYLLKIIKRLGLAVDAMSPIELKLDELAGFEKEDILYVCNNVSQDEMVEVVDKGIMICLDSISQVEQLGKVRPGSEIMVRINPGSFTVGHSKKVITAGENTKFGVSEANLHELFKVASKYDIKIIGVHQHLGSLFLNDKIDEYVAGVKAGLDIVKKYFKDLSIVDLGGGFGVPYKGDECELSLDVLGRKLIPVLQEFLQDYPNKVEFKFEPGRYVVCEAGYILGTVTAVKNENGKIWIGTDVGMNVLARPTLYDAYHEIEIIKRDEKDVPLVSASIVGNVCESGDILGTGRLISSPEVGDIVKVYNAGAYGYSMASSYTGRSKPAEVLVWCNGKNSRLIRKRETFEDMVSMFVDF